MAQMCSVATRSVTTISEAPSGNSCANSCLEQSIIVIFATSLQLWRIGMCSIGLLVNYLYINRDQLAVPATRQPADLPWESLLCRLGSVTALRVDGQTDLERFSSRVISWFHMYMSTSRKLVSLNEGGGAHALGLKTTRGVFGALSLTGSGDHSHSGFREDKGL